MSETCGCGGGGACGSGHACGCCQDVESRTPEPVENRPGLEALSWRAGTHASFLDTMKAGLASSGSPELAALTTRTSDDPSIALLDAWATVADVLTFYQERIANEGYLRTATERRSVLELGRLVGYVPRPGVAATTYLSFELEAGHAVEVPAGSRAQSVPGPGELPQTFETSEPVKARAEWNDLQVRRTRPQVLVPGRLLAGGALYFQGIATGLRPNDPLLIDFGASQEFYRVLEVTPEPMADRTRVAVQPWTPQIMPEQAPPRLAAVIREGVERFRQNVPSPSSATGRRVLSHLGRLHTALESDPPDPEVRALLDGVLQQLRQEHEAARGFSNLGPWIGDLVSGLEAAMATAPSTEPAPIVTTATASSAPARLDQVLKSLEKPVSIPPKNRQRLERSLELAFAPESDLRARLLQASRPELAGNFYAAWANLPVTAAPIVAVYALRQRASVFGHNAPLRTVQDAKGRIVRTEEWELKRSSVAAGEELRIELTSGQVAGRETQGTNIVIRLGDRKVEHPGPGQFGELDPSFTIDFRDAGEVVDVTVSQESNSLTFAFRTRGARVSLGVVGDPLRLETFTEGLDPATLTTSLRGFLNQGGTVEGIVRGASGTQSTELVDVVFLDALYPQVLPQSWVVLERPDPVGSISTPIFARANEVTERSRAAYGLTGKSTRIRLSTPWLELERDTFAAIRGTAVFAQSERLVLAEEPIDPVAEAVCGQEIELQALYEGLEAGRWIVVSGERTDVLARTDEAEGTEVRVSGVRAQELAMLAGIEQIFDEALPGDRTHTRLVLANGLAYCYRRDTVVVHGNVARATHGESRFEPLGGGDASQSLQRFPLRQSPLTWVPAPTPSGVESTLQVRVNDVLWHEAPSLAGLGPADRAYVTRTDDEGRTTVTFCNGERGARPSTSAGNINATLRIGLGRGGNLAAGRISQLATRPLGVRGVTNPVAATGGADAESRDQARGNVPLAVKTLDRLISVRDYEDFTRTFAGIGKASAARLTDGRRQLVHVTLAGEGDIPIAKTSDLFRNLEEALRRFGDPGLPLALELREAALLVVEAKVRVQADHLWEKVEPKVRAALLDVFGFDRRDLGQDVTLSEVIAAIQRVPGVDRVDVDYLGKAGDEIDPAASVAQRIPAHLARVEDGGRRIRPAQIVFLSPAVPDTLILQEIPA